MNGMKNLKQIIDQLETLGSLTTQQEGLMLDLGIQVLRAENLKEDLEKKIKDYEDAAKMAELAAWIDSLDAL